LVGKTLGHYEILEPLGAGGMGEVYRARDATLKREVAIKVLPEDLSTDPDRLARLEREAHLLAALNHPNIATIHSLEQAADTRFLVLELVKGESLEQRLAKGRLPTEAALDLCKQIAEALEAAHGEGIIHRDLKPANVLITPQGRVKVLDFGLAKAFEANAAAGDISQSPTLTVASTQTGVILGTAPYMSPEQVRGLPLDKRVDIWAFGCLLYETLTLSRAFARETVADTLAAILEAEPNWGALPGATPQMIGVLVERCLRKDPSRRLHDIADARIEIEEVLSGGTDATSATLAAPAGRGTTGVNPWKLAIPLAIAGALLGAVGMWSTRPPPPEVVVKRFRIDAPRETAFYSGSVPGTAISPDGKFVVFSAGRQLWKRPVGDPNATPIAGTEGARTPFFSPDGRKLGFAIGSGDERQIRSVSIAGGPPERLGSTFRTASGASWEIDGYIYFGQGPDGIMRVAEDGAEEATTVVPLKEGEQALGPQLLPGGEWLLFTLLSGSDSWSDASIVAQKLAGGERRVLISRGADGRYVPTGHIVYAFENRLFAVPFDVDNVDVYGESATVVDGVQWSSRSGTGHYAFSDNGDLVFLPSRPSAGWQLAWVHRQGGILEPLPHDAEVFGEIELSPDGRHIAAEINAGAGKWDVWIYETEKGGSRWPLTTGGSNSFPLWSLDGEWVYFKSTRNGNDEIWKAPLDRSSGEQLVWNDAEAPVRPDSISEAGMMLFARGAQASSDIGMLAVDSGQSPEMVVATGANEKNARFSPDGRLFAFQSDESGQFEVYLQEVGSGKKLKVSTSLLGGRQPNWSRSGREIFYRPAEATGILVVEVDVDSWMAWDPVELTDIRMLTDTFSVTDDGQRILGAVVAGSLAPDWETPFIRLEVVLNWFEDLKRLVPTGR